MTAVTTISFDCPRCGSATNDAFYGPCPDCRTQLRTSMQREAKATEHVDYEPKMNVVPNQIASKD